MGNIKNWAGYVANLSKAFLGKNMLVGMGAGVLISVAAGYLNMSAADVKGAICGAPLVPMPTPTPSYAPPPPPPPETYLER